MRKKIVTEDSPEKYLLMKIQILIQVLSYLETSTTLDFNGFGLLYFKNEQFN